MIASLMSLAQFYGCNFVIRCDRFYLANPSWVKHWFGTACLELYATYSLASSVEGHNLEEILQICGWGLFQIIVIWVKFVNSFLFSLHLFHPFWCVN